MSHPFRIQHNLTRSSQFVVKLTRQMIKQAEREGKNMSMTVVRENAMPQTISYYFVMQYFSSTSLVQLN